MKILQTTKNSFTVKTDGGIYLEKKTPTAVLTGTYLTCEQNHRVELHPPFQMSHNFN